MDLTTTPSLEGRKIARYCGIVAGEAVLGANVFKTGEGLWAEISGSICKTGIDFQAHMTKEQIHLGSAAPWMLNLALADGGTFSLRRREPNQLQIETQGWTGRFISAEVD